MGRLLRGPDDGDDSGGNQSGTDDQKADDQKSDDQKADDKADGQKADDQKTDDQKSDDQKSDDDKTVAAEPLTVTDIAVPEGFEIDPAQAEDFLKIVNDGEMDPKDKVNALIALHAKTINAASEASSEAWDNVQTEWKDAVKADPDVGGAKLQPTLANIGKLLDEYGTPELKEVFDLTGAGNNIHMVKFLNTISEKLTEGKFFTGGSPTGDSSPDAAAKRMFPSMKG